MSRYSIASKSGAYLAGTNGQPPSSRIGAQSKNARPVAGVTEYSDWTPPTQDNSCSSLTRDGADCKARPVRGTDLCVGHTRQAEKANV